ncbi:MAG: hypothetical protein M3475_08040, partial [Actinomycetota bacterium]|nr:hypothetical protein [Actinomycetota bacterium]
MNQHERSTGCSILVPPAMSQNPHAGLDLEEPRLVRRTNARAPRPRRTHKRLSVSVTKHGVRAEGFR